MSEGNGDSSVDLLLRAQSGDEEARDRLLARHLPRLRRWTTGRLPWSLRTMLDTGDLVQEAVIKVLPHLNTLEIFNEHPLQFYLQQAVKNRIIDLHRCAGRRPVRKELPQDIVADNTSPLEAAIGAEGIARYEQALRALKKKRRDAVVLRLEFGLSYEKIAEHLGQCKVDAARMMVTRGIAQLAAEMGRLKG